MPLPTKVVIAGSTFTVRLAQAGQFPGSTADMGSSDLRKQMIVVADDCAHDQERDTVIHEIFHMLARLLCIEDRKIGDEKSIGILATGWYDILTRNPQLLEYLTEPRADPDA